MEYEDMTVTKQSGDKGVDVVAMYQFGITTIKEVVQVKWHKGSIGGPVLDQLRGSLPYHSAIRWTITTLVSFSKGCKENAIYPGAVSNTLIDGDKLLELLIRHGICIDKKSIEIYEVKTRKHHPDFWKIKLLNSDGYLQQKMTNK